MSRGLVAVEKQIPGHPGISEMANIQALAAEFGVEKTLNGDALLQYAVVRYEAAHADIVAAGMALLRYKAESEHGDFLPFLAERGISSQRASEMMRLGTRLLELPPSKRAPIIALSKSRQVAVARFSSAEISYAIDRGELEQLATMSHTEAHAWRKVNFARQLSKDTSSEDDAALERERAAMLALRKPLVLEVATDELIGAVVRAQLELDRALKTAARLLPAETDEWRAARVELAHAARIILRAAQEEAEALDDMLQDHFGAASLKPLEGEYRTLGRSQLQALGAKALEGAERDTHARTVARNERLPEKPKGAPPKTLESLLAKFGENVDA